jgi:ParB/RepB/Spo0J family partition protein
MTAATQSLQMIALASIFIAKTNPRKTHDKLKHEELTSSIKLKGVLQPILVRPRNADSFEIVAGERRFKAAKAAGLEQIPAQVKELTDAEALEAAVIENGQREDLHPLEEAEGYEALLKCKHPDGVPYTVNDIADRVGKSGSYVYKKLTLCRLCAEGRKAFYDGKIDFSRALLLARINGDNLQREAMKEITEVRFAGDEPMTMREAQLHVQQHYMLALDKAPFSPKDATLVPKAGACTDCPKRTGNSPELFADVKSGDVCTDPPCFDSKRQAHTIRLVDAAKAKGTEVISGKDAKKIAPMGVRNELKGYIALDRETYMGDKFTTARKVLGKDAPQSTLLEDPESGALVEVVKKEDAGPLLKLKLPKRAVSTRADDSYAKKQREKEQKARKERELRKRIYFAARDHVATKGMDVEDVRLVVAAVWARHWHDHKKAIAPWWYPEDNKGKKLDRIEALTKRIATMGSEDLIRLLVDCAIVPHIVALGYGAAGAADELEAFARRHGVDVAGIKRATSLESKASEKKAKKSAPRKAAAEKKKPKK